jgi:hypothetical protein
MGVRRDTNTQVIEAQAKLEHILMEIVK